MIFGKYVNKYYIKYAIHFIIGVIALIAVDYFQLLIPNIYGSIVDGLNDGTLFANGKDVLVDYMLKLFGIAFIMFSGRFCWRYFISGAAVNIEADMRDEMYRHSEKLSTRFYKEHKTGGLMAYFTNDLQTIKNVFASGTIMLIDALFLGIMALIFMFKLNVTLTFLALIPMALIVFLSLYVGRLMKAKFALRQKAFEDLSDFSQENFSGINVVKAFVKEINEIKEFAKINKNNQDANINFARTSAVFHVLLTLIISSIIGLILGYGGYLAVTSESFTAGTLLQFVAYFQTLVWPMMAIGQLINMRSQAQASLERISSLLDEPIEIVDSEDVDKDASVEGKIEFRHLNFKYPDGSDNVLKDISFTIEKGEMVGIIGKTGCGKTTIVDLLLRVYNVEENTILFDDQDIMKIPFKTVRNNIGYVPQDNFLFSDTIKNNIAFAFDEEVSDDKVEYAAALADVHNNIVEFEHQYHTVVGERGVTLSGGQKQRVSIARALVKDPNIIIFDDSVSAVDTKTEEKILENLRKLRRGKTSIMIAHRISTVRDLDKIILMDEGRIVGVGTHDELEQTCPMYAEMVRLQALEQEVDGGKA